jgi:hypothetical protein
MKEELNIFHCKYCSKLLPGTVNPLDTICGDCHNVRAFDLKVYCKDIITDLQIRFDMFGTKKRGLFKREKRIERQFIEISNGDTFSIYNPSDPYSEENNSALPIIVLDFSQFHYQHNSNGKMKMKVYSEQYNNLVRKEQTNEKRKRKNS